MAVVEYSALVNRLRGSVGGVTFSKGGPVEVVKGKARPRLPQRPLQLPVQGAMQKYSPIWRTLSQSDRDDWDTYAATVTFQNSLGQDYQINGFQMFVRSQMFEALRGTEAAATIPTDTGLPSVPTITLDYNSDDLRVFSISPSLTGNQEIRGTVYAPAQVSRAAPSGRVVSTFELLNTGGPDIIAADYGINFQSGLELRAYVDLRFIDGDFRLSNNQRLSLDFTVS